MDTERKQSMNPDQERLSEQEWPKGWITVAMMDGSNKLYVPMDVYRSLTRQLTEAEQDKYEILEELIVVAQENRGLKESLRRCGELALSRKTGAIQHHVKKVLGIEHFSPSVFDTGDSPESPPKDSPKSGSGEEAGGA